ncbi:MAG: acyltransferase [Coprococcus sp.]
MGGGTVFFAPQNVCIDVTRPWLISIGNNVQITSGVTILTHGYDWAVVKGVYGEILGSSGEVRIGNNVFIGMNSTILKGAKIGNNVIIGANSLVNKDIPDNVVVAGNPAVVVSSLEEYYNKRKKKQIDEAKELVRVYRQRYNREVDEKALHEFFFLFEDGKKELHPVFQNMMKLVGNEKESYEKLSLNIPSFKNMQDFLNHVDDSE